MASSGLRASLENSGAEYGRLAAQHRHYDELLVTLTRKTFLTPTEDIERIRLKKLKLRLKDRMAALMRQETA